MTYINLKRVLDILLSTILLIIISPIFIIAVLIILFSDFGPVFFKQERVGHKLKNFKILKFRTMKIHQNGINTTQLNDPRVFRFGHFLRKYKIDELPQLINVLRGEMSLVGPRPTSIEDVNKMNNLQKGRHSFKPGMTGLAQISGNTSLKWDERIEFDLYYINNWSFYLDIKIMLKTFIQVISGNADTHPNGENEWN